MPFHNPLLKAAFEENKFYLENRLKILEDVNRDILELEENLKKLNTPKAEKILEEGVMKWDGKNIKFNDKQLKKCETEIKLKIHPLLIDFLKFLLKGEN